MNNLVYSNEIFRAICTEWFKYTAEQPMNDRGGILLEDFTEIFNRADRLFDPKPKEPLIEDHTDEPKNSDEHEKAAEATIDVPESDDVKTIERAIKDADDVKPKKCSRCGKEFTPTSNRQRVCPDCKKAEQKAATAKYKAKKKQADDHGISQAVKDIIALGDDNEG